MKKLILMLLCLLMLLTGCIAKRADISVIGGADGPTSIIVAD